MAQTSETAQGGVDLSRLTLQVTKPRSRAARRLGELGVCLREVAEDEGNVDRYIVSTRLVIERRTSTGFLAGIMDKTLFTSAIYLREHFHIPVLIVEGKVDYQYRGFDPQAVRGALSSMMIEYGINVLSTEDTEDTVQLIAMMARQEQIGIPEISLVPKRSANSLADMQRRVVEMLPGCGRVTARDLLQQFGSVARIVAADESDLRGVRGIGAKKASQIRQVLNAEYEAVDTERQIEDAIEIDPTLLFEQPVTLLARQHHIYDDEHERHIVDMAFHDEAANELILVELKRGRLEPKDRAQLCRYLDHAAESPMLWWYIDNGCTVRGVLASPEETGLKPRRDDVTIFTIDRQRVIDILTERRRQRLG